MKAGGLIVLISVLMSTLNAQTTEPRENLSAPVLRTAEMIGVRSQVEELVQLRSKRRNEMKSENCSLPSVCMELSLHPPWMWRA